MDFTREPIIETIITPKEGYKLVIRSSKTAGQEEYFVDAVEIVAFGDALFFRSMERPKAFLVPVSDYEILEVREARMVLKNVGLDRSIKIGGGKEANLKAPREEEKIDTTHDDGDEQEESQTSTDASTTAGSDVRVDKKRDRRRHYRKRRGRDENGKETAELTVPSLEGEKIVIAPPVEGAEAAAESLPLPSPSLSSLLQPPPTLISETINRYRQNDLFKGAFYLTEEEQYKPHDKVHELLNEEDEEETAPTLQEPTFESPELSEENASEEVLDGNQVVEKDVEGQLAFEEKIPASSDITLPVYAQEEDPSMKEIFSSTQPQEEKAPQDHSHDHQDPQSHDHHHNQDQHHHTEQGEQEPEKNQE